MPVGKKKRPKKFSGNSVIKRSPLWTYIHIRALYRYNAENKSNNSSLHLANRPVRPDLHLNVSPTKMVPSPCASGNRLCELLSRLQQCS